MALYPRLIEQRVADAMSDTRVVSVVGPRQSGKTTLAKKMANEEMDYYTLDNATTLVAATQDPVGFVRRMDRAIISCRTDAVSAAIGLRISVRGRYMLIASETGAQGRKSRHRLHEGLSACPPARLLRRNHRETDFETR
jgi:hypothetical protein